eukprot:gene5026-5684_t
MQKRLIVVAAFMAILLLSFQGYECFTAGAGNIPKDSAEKQDLNVWKRLVKRYAAAIAKDSQEQQETLNEQS